MVSSLLLPFADGVWIGTAPVSFIGLQLTATMTVLRLADRRLLLYSPVAMTPERRGALEALGTLWSRGRSLTWQGGSARQGGQPGLHIRPYPT